MGKSKKGLSDIVRSKRNSKGKSSTVNPFELQINKVKHVVVNRRVEKWEKGQPGVSRSKAIQKRQDTILNELRQVKKTNVFHDKRIGENDSTLTAEEKMSRRYALERKARMNKQDIFNLNEDEVELTHYGQSLAENLKDRPGSDSDDDDLYADKGNTGRYQFGGFSNGEEASWKDKMQEVIVDSKKQKYERQVEREKTMETTKELDDVWTAMKTIMKPLQMVEKGPNTSNSSYMMLSRSLTLERTTGQASDKLKTEEEAARDVSERLKKLEAQRLERMRGAVKKTSNHVSADSLSSGMALDKKGRMKVSFADYDQSDDDDEEGVNDDANGAAEDGDGNGSDDEDDSDDDDDDDDDGDDDSESDEDNYSDLDDNDNDDDGEDIDDDGSGDEKEPEKKTKSILKKLKQPSIAANGAVENELPYVFEAPSTYEELKLLLHGHTASDQVTILSRLRKCYHVSLAAENKGKLQKIHLLVLQHLGEVAREIPVDGILVDGLFSHVWDLTQTFSRSAAKYLQSIVVEKQKEYSDLCEKRGGRGLFPFLDTLLYLRLVEILFPTSDFVHEVTTPAMHFITQMLAESSVRNLKDVSCGLYLSALCLQFVHSSQRYVPEIATFLHGVLYLASCGSKADSSSVFQPFRKANRESCQLEMKEKCDAVSSSPLSLSRLTQDSSEDHDTNQLKCDLVNTCVDLVDECVTVWSKLPCLSLVMSPIDVQLKCLPTNLYPTVLKDKIEKLTSRFEESRQVKFVAMQLESKKPEPMKLFEPLIEENWSGKSKKGGSDREAANRKRMVHVYKRDMRSAVREIRRDHAVIAKHKLDVTLQKDAERKRKVKEIMAGLASQEGDFNAIKKQKKHMK